MKSENSIPSVEDPSEKKHDYEKLNILILYCKDLGKASPNALLLVEDLLSVAVKDYALIVDADALYSWIEESFGETLEEKVRKLLNVELGDILLSTTVKALAAEVDELINTLLADNHGVMIEFSNNWAIDSVKVIAKLQHCWALTVTGTKLLQPVGGHQ